MVAEVTAVEAFAALSAEPGARLIDVRTAAEWATVGVPAMDGLVRVSWVFPGGVPNAAFLDDVAASGVRPGDPLYVICRSGVRSLAAARMLADAGYSAANVAAGFEAPGGWLDSGLPALPPGAIK